ALTLIAVGTLSTLDSYVVGKVAYPQEPFDQRLYRISTEAVGSANLFVVRGYTQPPYLNPRPAAPVSLAQYLDELCNMAGAIANDASTASIIIESPGSTTGANPRARPPADVLYSPTWKMMLPVSNKATAPYGTANPQLTKTASDAASIAAYG